MGEIAEYYLEQDILCGQFDFGDAQELTWLTKDEGAIPVSKMKDSHINNCLQILQRRKQDSEFWIAAFSDELRKRKL